MNLPGLVPYGTDANKPLLDDDYTLKVRTFALDVDIGIYIDHFVFQM